jgi:spheroidene monooxygenase
MCQHNLTHLPGAQGMTQIVTISFYRFGSLRSRVWAFAMMGLARRQMSRIPGIGFWKLFGSGSNEGFTPKPNVSVYAVLATWPDRQTAERRFATERHLCTLSSAVDLKIGPSL